MEILKNAGDLGGRQSVRVYCKPIKVLSDIGSIMRALSAIPGLLLLLIAASADELPVIKDSEAVQYVGKNVEVRGLVVSVTVSPLGTACISFGREYPDQTFAGFIAVGSKMETDQRIATLQGKIIGITGTIELHQGKPEIKVTSADQIKGLNSQLVQ
jgi:DNA/RNA endonuclease YhcR with UshA esterase domain